MHHLLILKKIPKGKHHYIPPFIDRETEAQTGEVTHSKSHSQKGEELGFRPRRGASRVTDIAQSLSCSATSNSW